MNSGYRAQIVFTLEGREAHHDFLVTLDGASHSFRRDDDMWLPLGVEDTVLLTSFRPEAVRTLVTTDRPFAIYEGPTRVGDGRVTGQLVPLAAADVTSA